MKKVFGTTALAALLWLAGASASEAVTISSTTAADTATPPIQLQVGESATWSVAGLSTGTIALQRSRDMATWDVVATSVTAGNIAWSGTVRAESRATFFRFQVSTITVGQVYITQIADVDDPVQTIANHKGLPVVQINDESMRVAGNFESTGVLPSTATTSGTSLGNSIPMCLSGNLAAIEGHLLVSTHAVAGCGPAVMVSTLTIDVTTWFGIAKAAASTGSIVDVYYDGFVLALTTGTVNPGDTLVSTNTVRGYLGADTTPTTGAEVGIAMSAGTAAGGRVKIRMR